MKKKKRIALALAAALMMVLLLAACSDKTIRLGVAGIGGVYQVFGEDYAALQAQNGGRKLEVRETAGSAASLRLLSSGYLQMAAVQADMAQDAYNPTGAFAESEVENNFSTVAVLYQEECHIVVRADSGINTVEKLQGKTVSIGEEESGTEQNAKQILAAYGLDEKLVKEVNLNYTDAAKQLRHCLAAGRWQRSGPSAGRLSGVQPGRDPGGQLQWPGPGCADHWGQGRAAGK